ncbi:MAG: DUF1289 domain-containing protein [Planctomycetes bacterium]|nr:DUF1289 domain-containing protein [Planctomycetota bacterium]
MRVTPLASGSQGNATLVETAAARVLIDAGLGADDLEERLAAVGVAPRGIDAILLTHRHRDHRHGARDFALRHRTPVWASRRTARSLGTELHRRLRELPVGAVVVVAGLAVRTLPLSHDAPETVALVLEHGGARYGHVTDLGSFDAALATGLAGCDALLLEFNHDLAQLWAGDDPLQLKRRIAGNEGHLSNADAAALLAAIAGPRLRMVWLAHLSARNNTAELALAAARSALGDRADVRVEIAQQDRPSVSCELPIELPVELPVEPPPRSPCIGVCVLDPQEVCLGCLRSRDEIARWPRVDDAGRRAILRSAARRLAERVGEPGARGG